MKLDSLRSFKAQVSEEVKAQADFPAAQSFYESTEAPMPAQMALGVAKRGDEHVLAIRTSDPVAAEKMAARVNGEADIVILTVEARNTPGYFQARRRPLEPGQQVGMTDRNFVGTLGAFAWDSDGHLGVVSNAHVLADSGLAQIGHPFGQPYGGAADRVGVLTRWVLPSRLSPGTVDAAFARLDRTTALTGYTGATPGGIRGVRQLGPEDIGREVVKCGRTTGARLGKVTVVEVDGLTVSYPSGLLTFNDQHEITGGQATDFSAAGDSGSMILTTDGWAVGLLFAGGVANGVDYTYANSLQKALQALGVTLAL